MGNRNGLVFPGSVARVLQLSAIVVALAVLGHAPASVAETPLKTITWGPTGSPYNLKGYDCAKEGVGTIFIQGTLELVHPDDKPGIAHVPEIYLHCENFIFVKDSKILVKAALYIRGDKTVSGAVNIENTRSVAGKDAVGAPSLYARTKAADGPNGAHGSNGDSAADTSHDYPMGRNADNGGEGGPGGRGTDGIAGAPASGGRPGTAAAPITVKAGTYGAGTTIVMTARGGDAGKGADGGTGRDGGDGGVGGTGGRGGDAAVGRTAGHGGRGGAGGDGGNGGWGGAGGDGGYGGRGGDAKVLIVGDNKGNHGNPPADWTYYLEGGKGGAPGIGGAPGRLGKGKPGGFGGCGGSGSNLGPIIFHPEGACAGQGPHGKDGVDGQPGPPGKWGKDGDPGEPGGWTIGIVVETGGH